MKLSFKSDSAEQTRGVGEKLAAALLRGDVLGLVGELGAGKTELVKGIASGLGSELSPPVTSPTYVLLREYPGRLWLYHFDFYRLKSEREIDGIGYEEYFDGDGVSAVEWADKFPSVFPQRTLWIKLSVAGELSREIEINGDTGLWQMRLQEISGSK